MCVKSEFQKLKDYLNDEIFRCNLWVLRIVKSLALW